MPKYKTISWQDANSNTEYKKVVEPIFREQAARIIQRAGRQSIYNRLAKEIKTKQQTIEKIKSRETTVRKKYNETINSPLSLRFLKEPWGTQATKHADKILAGKYLELDFKDPEFERNMFKALHQEKINANQMATALLLHNAIEQYEEAPAESKYSLLRQFDFTKGPYFVSSISYSTIDQVNEFYETNIKRIPKSERCYFTINFSYKFTLLFFYFASKRKDLVFTETMLKALRLFIPRLKLQESEQQKLISLIDKINYSAASSATFTEILKPLIFSDVENNSDTDEKIKKDFGSADFLINILTVGEQLPTLILSPDFNADDKNSPILSLVLPTISALNELQYSVHKADTTNPFFVAGQISTRLIRSLDEKIQARPVELAHPDLIPNKNPHGATVHKFMLTWHDIFHTWCNGTNMYKPFIRHLRCLLTKETGFDMSTFIWKLTDMDYRMRLLRNKKNPIVLAAIISMILRDAGCDLSYASASPGKLIIIIDMIVNNKQWAAFSLPDFLADTKEINCAFQNVYRHLEEIIHKHPNQSTLFYILAYNTRYIFNVTEHALLQHVEWNKMLHWERNGNLFFNKQLIPKTRHTLCIDLIHEKELAKVLAETAINATKNEKIPKMLPLLLKPEVGDLTKIDFRNMPLKMEWISIHIKPEQYLAISLQIFIHKQIDRLQLSKKDKASADSKIVLYQEVLRELETYMHDSKSADHKFLKDSVSRCAHISSLRSHRTHHKLSAAFTRGIFTRGSTSYLHWLKLIADLQKHPELSTILSGRQSEYKASMPIKV